METPDEFDELDRGEIRKLYAESINHFKYSVDNVWRCQKYYTTLNTAILGGAIGLGRLDMVGTLLSPWTLPFFITGTITSFIGWKSIIQLRRYYLQARLKKICFEHILGYRNSFSISGNITTDLTISWKSTPTSKFQEGIRGFEDLRFDKIEEALSKEWIEKNIHKRGSVTYWFIILHRVFFVINITIILLIFILNEKILF